jgi:hypothetical protein
MSLADDIVICLAEVRTIGLNLDSEHPMRHAVHNLQRTAEDILSNASRQASNLAHQAHRIVKDFDAAKRGAQ